MRRSIPRLLDAIIMGAPGGGKGTISKKLVKDFKFTHISTGDILRRHIAEKTATGEKVEAFIKSGQLVPDQVVVDVLHEEIDSLNLAARQMQGDSGDNNSSLSILLDGFPRTIEQAKQLAEWFPLDVVISLHIPHETIMERMAQRWIHAPSGRVYAYDYNPPKVAGQDDVTGEPLTQREDDKPEVVRSRLEDFEVMTTPLLDFYQHLNPVNCNNKSVKVQCFHGTESNVIYKDVYAFVKDL